MKHLLCFVFAVLSWSAQAQDPIGKMIIGFETGFDVQHFKDGIAPRVIPGLQFEMPVWKFSVGIGLSKKFYRDYEYYFHNGKTESVLENEQPVTMFLSDVRAFKPSYWAVPIKINYRFVKCNCVYFHAAVMFETLDSRKDERTVFTDARTREQPLGFLNREKLMRKHTTSYEFGIGFKLHSSDYFRIIARPTFVLSQNPEIYHTDRYLPSIRMTFGAQYAFVHY
jgi:hypothetical protein